MAIKKKTKAQKAQDIKYLARQKKKLIKAVDDFKTDLYESEFNLQYIRLGAITDMFDASANISSAKDRIEKTHTRENVWDDQKNENYYNATNLDNYDD